MSEFLVGCLVTGAILFFITVGVGLVGWKSDRGFLPAMIITMAVLVPPCVIIGLLLGRDLFPNQSDEVTFEVFIGAVFIIPAIIAIFGFITWDKASREP